MTIGDNIKKARKDKKRTQHQLAEDLHISRSYLGDIENDRYNPSSKTLEVLAQGLDVTVHFLVTGETSSLAADLKRSEQMTPDTFNIDHIDDLIQEFTQIALPTSKEITRNGRELERHETLFLSSVYDLISQIDTSELSESELTYIRKEIAELVYDHLYRKGD